MHECAVKKIFAPEHAAIVKVEILVGRNDAIEEARGQRQRRNCCQQPRVAQLALFHVEAR